MKKRRADATKGVSMQALEEAMDRHLEAKRIAIGDSDDRPSRRIKVLRVT